MRQYPALWSPNSGRQWTAFCLPGLKIKSKLLQQVSLVYPTQSQYFDLTSIFNIQYSTVPYFWNRIQTQWPNLGLSGQKAGELSFHNFVFSFLETIRFPGSKHQPKWMWTYVDPDPKDYRNIRKNINRSLLGQCCGTVTIFYGSGSDCWQVTVPVSVPAPYLDHKKQIKKKRFGTNLTFLHSKLF